MSSPGIRWSYPIYLDGSNEELRACSERCLDPVVGSGHWMLTRKDIPVLQGLAGGRPELKGPIYQLIHGIEDQGRIEVWWEA